jgi:hypothetical protein
VNIIERKLKESGLVYVTDWNLSEITNLECIKTLSKDSKGKFPYFYTWYAKYQNNTFKLNLCRKKEVYPFIFHIFCKDCNISLKENVKISSLFAFTTSDINELKYSERFSIRCKKCSSKRNGTETKDKARQTCLKRFGYDCSFNKPDFHTKSKETKIQKYGLNYQRNAAKKSQQTYFNKTGFTHNMRNPDCVKHHVENRRLTISRWNPDRKCEFNKKRLLSYSKDESQGLFGKKNKNKNNRSKISIDFYENLVNNTQHYICVEEQIGRYIVDFLIPNVCIIEFYGTFWHADPRKFKADDIIRVRNGANDNPTAYSIWKRDTDRIKFLVEETKLPCIIVWEDDYRQNKQKTINKVLKKIKCIHNKHLTHE